MASAPADTGLLGTAFNGGKMQHIFKRGDDRLYTNEFTSDESREALLHGVAYVKVDGSNACVFRAPNGGWGIYQRYDDKKGKLNPDSLPPGYRKLPHGGNMAQFAAHHYFYKLLEKPGADAKGKQAKLMRALYTRLDNPSAQEALDALMDQERDGITVELVGTKFNRTPGVTHPAHIAVHEQQTYDLSAEQRTFEGLRRLLCDDVCTEGFVLRHNGVYWKVRSDTFQHKCLFDQVRRKQLEISDLPAGIRFLYPKLLGDEKQSTDTVASPHPSTVEEKTDVAGGFATSIPTILLFGDSITQQGFAPGGWAARVADAYVRRADVINRGLSGYNTRWALKTLPSVFPRVPPALVTVFFGANDASLVEENARQHVPLKEYSENLRRILTYIQEFYAPVSVPVAVMTPPPVCVEQRLVFQKERYGDKATGKPARTNEMAGKYAAAARDVVAALKKPHPVRVLDLWTSMQHDKTEDEWKQYLSDGLHLSPSGNSFVASQLLDLVWTQFPSLRIEPDPITGSTANSAAKSPMKLFFPPHDMAKEILEES